MVKTIDFNFPILKNKLKNHKELKSKLIEAIDKQNCGRYSIDNKSYKDSISKLDWDQKNNHTRPWVSILIKDLFLNFTEQVKKIGLEDVIIHDIWFQQYIKGDTHGWHKHGHNFTGVYYLELNDSCPRTELIEPISLNKINIEAEEGDVVIFPSIYIHRAPKVTNNVRKTIVSFNFSAELIETEYLNKLKKMYG